MDVARQMNIDLSRGYLFRPTTPAQCVADAAFTFATADARLKVHLRNMGIDEGETLHGF